MATRIKDILAAEEALDEALAEQRKYDDDSAAWSGFESVDDQGLRKLSLNRLHFDRQELMRSNVAAAAQRLHWVKKSFFEGQ